MGDALMVLRSNFTQWVEAHNRPRKRRPEGFATDPHALFGVLQERIPQPLLELIGDAFSRGWLETADDGRGYFVRETSSNSPPQPAVYHAGNGLVIPWWELYVQLADYARIRKAALSYGLTIRMEDRQMDITVWAGERMLMYVENKVTAAAAEHLLTRMRAYGETGFEMTDENRGNDPLRKAMYLFQEGCRPRYFGLSAIGYEQLFEIEYLGTNNRFRLVEQTGDVTTALSDSVSAGPPPERLPADLLAVELERASREWQAVGEREFWLAPGSGQTAFNGYCKLPTGRDAIVLGVYRNGRVWSDIKALGPALAATLAAKLEGLGVALGLDKEWSTWRAQGVPFELTSANAPTVADAVAEVMYG